MTLGSLALAETIATLARVDLFLTGRLNQARELHDALARQLAATVDDAAVGELVQASAHVVEGVCLDLAAHRSELRATFDRLRSLRDARDRGELPELVAAGEPPLADDDVPPALADDAALTPHAGVRPSWCRSAPAASGACPHAGSPFCRTSCHVRDVQEARTYTPHPAVAGILAAHGLDLVGGLVPAGDLARGVIAALDGEGCP